MSFFQKLKQGAAKAADKAQRTVEMTKLSAQISGKRKEMERQFAAIGSAVYQAYQAGDLSLAEPEIIRISKEIEAIEREIEALKVRMNHLNDRKICACGKLTSGDAVYCPSCGRRFETKRGALEAEAAVSDEEQIIEETDPADAEREMAEKMESFERQDEPQTKNCYRCGEELETDAPYCIRCGAQQQRAHTSGSAGTF